jgi:hypothetical protein
VCLHELARALRVVDDGFDLAAVAHDARVLEEPRDVPPRKARDFVELEVAEGRAEVRALREDGAPAQTRLKTFEAQLFEQPPVVAHRKSPFAIVVIEEFRRTAAPAAAVSAVGSLERVRRAHGRVSMTTVSPIAAAR